MNSQPDTLSNHATASLPMQNDLVAPQGFASFDQTWEALEAPATGGLSPAALALAFFDWSIHLAASPGKRAEVAYKGLHKNARIMAQLFATTVDLDVAPCIAALPGDERFSAEGWRKPPFSLWAQTFLLGQQWWHSTTHGVPGVTPHHEDVVSFCARQLLDMFSPSNNPFANPEVIEKTFRTGGANLLQGWRNYVDDIARHATGRPPADADAFVVGRDVGVTPGHVIFRNRLIELIQYTPTTTEVFAEPVLIVPAWIMKYYILDLSPQNSLIRHLVENGHTVFCISWCNPTANDRDISLDDYRRLGMMAAIDAINAIIPERKIHATGYCLGGTLVSIAAAAMARAKDDRLASVTLLAAQADFTEPGELALFIDHSQMHFLESMMSVRGYLSADQMAGAFQLLRTNDLVWSRLIHEYLMGESMPMNDLMAWNTDTTRMPYRMHSEYLYKFYLNNELASGRYLVDGHPAVLQNIRAPMFVVGTERDHVAPWHSVYKIHALTDTEVTFVLTSGGHNAGIVSEPGHPHRTFRIATTRVADTCLDPEEWVQAATEQEGSWWPAWTDWLATNSTGERGVPPSIGAPNKGYRSICNAPGTYVFQH